MSIYLHDTHFHLDLFDNPKQVLKVIENEKIYTVAVTNIPDVFEQTNSLVKGSKYVRAALGFHPELCNQHYKQINKFLSLIGNTRYIGEIGLDNYSKAPLDYTKQKQVFEQIITACNDAGKKILTVHSRRAESDVVSIIGPNFSGKVILHWYSGSVKEIERAINYGFYFSINYAMTQSDNGKRIIDSIPFERMLLETDGPFVKVNGVPSTPVITKQIGKLVGEIKRDDNFNAIISNNFKALLL
jgi:TatD DNase family protein